MTAKELINKFYQPLGHLRCAVSSDELWKYAVSRALDVCGIMLQEHPMYKGDLNPDWRRWDELRKEVEALA